MLKIVRCILLAIVAGSLTLSAAEMMSGTWKLNLAKSKYTPGPAPKSVTFAYTQDGDWIVGKNESIDSEGKTSTATNRYKRDGKEYPFVSATGEKGTIVSKTIDANTTEATLKVGKASSVLRTVLAKDGKSFTRTTKGTNAQGQKFNNVVVFEKQ